MNHPKTYIGIDPGLDGGIATLVDGQPLQTRIMPTIKLGKGRGIDIHTLDMLFESWALLGNHKLVIEDPGPHAASASGLRSMTRSFSILETLAVVYKLPYQAVISKRWQDEFWTRPKMKIIGYKDEAKKKPIREKFDTKAAALVAAGRIWPEHEWRPVSEKTGKLLKNPHDGCVDAALLAEWGRRKF